MSFTAGISIISSTLGSTIKAKVLSYEDENYAQTFEIRIDENLQSAFQHLATLFQQCGEVKYVAMALPAYLKKEDRELIDKAGKDVFSNIRILKNLNLAHSNSLHVEEHPPQNHIVVEVGDNDAVGCLGLIEAEDGTMFYGDTEYLFVHDMGAIQPELLFNRTMQPFLDELMKKPTECGSEVHKIVVVDSSSSKIQPALAFQLYTLAQTRMQRAETPTEFVYDDGSKLLDHAAKTSRTIYDASLQPFTGCIFNVIPLNVSIAKADGFVTTFLRRNLTIPTQSKGFFTTLKDNQTEAHLQLMVGLAPRVVDNKPTGKLVLHGLPPKPRGEVLIRVSIAVDYYERMTVVAEEVGADLIPIANGARTTVELMSSTGEANLDKYMIEQLFVDYEKLDGEEDLRQSQEAEKVWADSSASGALPEKDELFPAEPVAPARSV